MVRSSNSSAMVTLTTFRLSGNINMTLSIMFCNAVQPQRLCTSDDVALQLTGLSHIPTEVDFIACTCADPRPMVLDRKSYGADHQQYHAFVCANHKVRVFINLICLSLSVFLFLRL